eukprot:11346929-Ditylum_brightwellii.AAC.1
MVLSSYMLSSQHSGYLKKRVQNRVGLIGQVGRITMNLVHLLLLLELVKRKKLLSTAARAKYNGTTLYSGISEAWKKQRGHYAIKTEVEPIIGNDYSDQKHKGGGLEDVKDVNDGMEFAWNAPDQSCGTCLDDEQVEVDYYDSNPDTCLFGKQVQLANFGEKVALVNEQTAKQDGYIFVDERQ